MYSIDEIALLCEWFRSMLVLIFALISPLVEIKPIQFPNTSLHSL
jgi:hypothetical protein